MNNFRLGSVRVIPDLNQVRFGRRVVHVQPKAMRLLLVLVEHPRRVVSREDLAQRVWDGRFPTDEVIARTVASLRKSLGDDSRDPRFIETIPKHGYRLIAPVAARRQRSANPVWSLGLATTALLLAAFVWNGSFERELPETDDRFEWSAQIAVGLSGYEEGPALGPGGKLLAFSYATRDRSSHRIHVADLGIPGAPAPLPLGQAGHDDRYPVWDPDGEEIAFIRRSSQGQCRIIRVSLATGTERLVTDCQASIITPIDWSPDGRTIVYADQDSLNPGRYRLHSADLNTGLSHWLTLANEPGVSDWWPRFSPDGRWLAHVRGTLTEQRIHLTATSGAGSRSWGGGGEGFLFGIAWLPDSSGVVYAFRGGNDVFSLWYLGIDQTDAVELGGRDWALPAIRGEQLAAVRLNHDFDVYHVDLTGDQTQPLSSVFDSSGIDGDPALSPDGRQAVLISNRSGKRALWLTDVSTDNASSAHELLRPQFGRLKSPSWSGDGSRVAVLEKSGSETAIWVVGLEGQTAESVFRSDDQITALSWSMDDSSLIFGSDRGGEWQVWRLDPGNGTLKQVTRHGAFRGRESVDGRWLYYCKYLTNGLYRIPVNSPDDEKLLLSELQWLDRDNWYATDRGIIVPLARTEDREAGLYRVDSQSGLELVSPAELYQSVKPEQAVAIDRRGSTALIVRPAFYQGNVVLVPLQSLPIPHSKTNRQ